MLVDIGANLCHSSFDDDLDQVLKRATEASIGQIIVTGSDLDNSQQAITLCEKYPLLLRATAGVHPHYSKGFNEQSARMIATLASHQMVVAIGETGLDFHRNFAPQDQQIKAFERQLELAAELELPVFLHEREANQRFTEMIADCRHMLKRAVTHCFTGDRKQLFRYLDLDLHIGLTGWICDERRGAHLLDLIGEIPCDRLMIETDAPYLAPRKNGAQIQLPQGRRNEPCTLPHVLAKIVEASGGDPEQVAADTTRVARAFFDLPDAL